MTYAQYEQSQQAGQPIELYTFQIGSTFYRYTSAEDQITFQSNLYYPRQISRGGTAQSNEQTKQQMEITLPTSDEVASRFIGIVPGQLMTLSIVRAHRNDPDQEGLVIWDGRITGASYKDSGVRCVLQGLTTEVSLSRPIPRFKYQGMCNHVLGDAMCQVDLASATHRHTAVVTAVSGAMVTVAGLSAKGSGWAVGGYVEYLANDWRLVLAQTGDVCTLLLPFADNVVGQTVTVVTGCDHSLDTCNTKFANTINYGGFPYVPQRNPFTAGVD